MPRANNVEGLREDNKCDKCEFLYKLDRGVYKCKRAESSRGCEISSTGKCLNHWNHTKAQFEKGTWHGAEV